MVQHIYVYNTGVSFYGQCNQYSCARHYWTISSACETWVRLALTSTTLCIYIYLQKWNVANRECARHYWTYLSTWATQNKLASISTTICNAKQQICARQFWTILSICGGQNMLASIPTTLYRCIFLSAMQPKENVPDIIGQSHPCAAHSNVI